MSHSSPPPVRDSRYAKPRYGVDRRADGAVVIANHTPYSQAFQTTNAALDHWAHAAPNRTWLAERSGAGWRRIGFGEARDRVAVMAGALSAFGVGPGRPLLILARNSIDHALITYAAMRLGAAAAPVSPQYGVSGADPARLAHAVALIGPACVFVDDAAVFAEALAGPALKGLPVVAGVNAAAGHHPLSALQAGGPPVADAAAPDQIAKLLLTSGSTGRPKAVVCAHRNIAVNAAQIAACFMDPDPPVLVNSAPWSHSMGANAILHTTLHRGGTLHIDAGQPTPARFGETLRNLGEVVTTAHYLVPAGWNLLVGELERDEALARTFFQQARVLQYGGAGLAQSVVDRVEAAAVRAVGEKIAFTAAYGATETGPTACNVHWESLRSGMIGMPMPGTTIKLAPQDDKFEIRVSGPQVSPGYYDARRSCLGDTRDADPGDSVDEDGFYRLGDAARIIDPDRLDLGLAFDGRLVENFKLATGAFVTAGALRLAALSAIGGAALDAVVCGEGQDGVGLMLFVDPMARQRLGETGLREAAVAGLRRLNAEAMGAGGRVARALILSGGPDPHSGELTDKGYINQALARARRAPEMARLFAEQPDDGVLVLE
jgi:feruloyl-CoA synthase